MKEEFYFAWIDEPEEFDPAVHNRMDEDVFAGKINQQEGDFAAADVEVRNPRIGLLNPGRKVWCYISFRDTDGTITPIFKGRLIALPDDIFEDAVTFQFTARPSDFEEQKQALADTLRELPYWDPTLISPDSWADNDTVLEARSAHWHIDPVTHVLTISDVLTPEDGVMEFLPNQFLRDGMSLKIGQTALRQCEVIAEFPWVNSGAGVLNVGKEILRRWPGKNPNYNLIWSFTFEGLAQSWPKAGTSVGDGWTVGSGELVDLSFLNVTHLDIPTYFDTGQIPASIAEGSIMFQPKITGKYWGGVDGAGYDSNVELVIAATGWGSPTLMLQYTGARDYSQTLDIVLKADVQSIVTDTFGDDVMTITLSANSLTDPDYWGAPALAGTARDYLHTPRGQQSIVHCLLIARANLCYRARAISLEFQAGFKQCIGVSLRKAALVHDGRIPGGQAAGKIVGYSHEWSDGSFLTSIELGCAIGYGNSVAAVAGTPSYIVDAYIDPTYYKHENEVLLIDTGDITYQLPPLAYFDDGIDFDKPLTFRRVVKELTIVNGPAAQDAALRAAIPGIGDQAAANAVLQTMPTQISLKMQALNTGPFAQGILPTTSTLQIPKQIDLEADSV